MILGNDTSTETTFYCRLAHNNIHLHWDSFSPKNWEVGTVTKLLLRVFVVCSNEELLNQEIEHLRNVFHHSNCYPKAVIQNVISKVKEEQSTSSVHITESYYNDVAKNYLFTLL